MFLGHFFLCFWRNLSLVKGAAEMTLQHEIFWAEDNRRPAWDVPRSRSSGSRWNQNNSSYSRAVLIQQCLGQPSKKNKSTGWSVFFELPFLTNSYPIKGAQLHAGPVLMVGYVGVTPPFPIHTLSLKAHLWYVSLGLHAQIPQYDIVPGEAMVSQCFWHFLLLSLVCVQLGRGLPL